MVVFTFTIAVLYMQWNNNIKTKIMIKNVLKLEDAQKLTNNEQKSINGGLIYACKTGSGYTGQSCSNDSDCIGPNSPFCFKGCCNTWV